MAMSGMISVVIVFAGIGTMVMLAAMIFFTVTYMPLYFVVNTVGTRNTEDLYYNRLGPFELLEEYLVMKRDEESDLLEQRELRQGINYRLKVIFTALALWVLLAIMLAVIL